MTEYYIHAKVMFESNQRLRFASKTSDTQREIIFLPNVNIAWEWSRSLSRMRRIIAFSRSQLSRDINDNSPGHDNPAILIT